MPRSALLQDYNISDGILLLDITNAGSWTANNAVLTDDIINVREGTGSVRLTTSDSDGYMQIAITPQKIPPARIDLWMYVHTDEATFADPGRTCLYFSSDGFSAPKLTYMQLNVHQRIVPGWNMLSFGEALFDGQYGWMANGELWSNEMNSIRIKFMSNGGQQVSATLDSIYVSADRFPRIMIHFDDAFESVYTRAYPVMADLGLVGTVYVCQNKIGTAGFMTLAQLQELYVAGWTMGNHTISHAILSSPAEGVLDAEVKGCTNWLIANEFSRGAYHLAYPGGAYGDELLAYLASNEYLTGRTTSLGTQCHQLVNKYRLHASTIEYPATCDNLKYKVNNVLGVTQNLYTLLFHDIVASGASKINEWDLSNFQELMEFIIASKIKCVTIDEWYEGLTNPRYTSLPL